MLYAVVQYDDNPTGKKLTAFEEMCAIHGHILVIDSNKDVALEAFKYCHDDQRVITELKSFDDGTMIRRWGYVQGSDHVRIDQANQDRVKTGFIRYFEEGYGDSKTLMTSKKD